MSTVLLCLCGCAKSTHISGKKACKRCGVCDAFELDGEVPMSEQYAEAVTTVDEALMSPPPDALSTSARLAKAEQERDEALSYLGPLRESLNASSANAYQAMRERDEALAANDALRAELAGCYRDLEKAAQERDDLTKAMPCGWCDGVGVTPGERYGRDADGAPHVDEDGPCPEGCEIPDWLKAERNDASDVERERDLARAELVSVRAELELWRTNSAELYAYDAWSCLTEGGCGSRYTMPAAALEHRCGPLTPVRVTITHHARLTCTGSRFPTTI